MTPLTDGHGAPAPRGGASVYGQDRARGVYYVAEADEGLVGQALVTTEWSDWNCCQYWWLQSVYVRPRWRRRGVFAAIYRHILCRARARSVAALRLYVHRANHPARTAYERVGMTETGYTVFEQALGRQ
ncbi:MAG: GNAT family N-acetyltransferase [Armatimonadota bacterium]|nr:GNAT family N-acetyltransferase [Armatimonadota bacterium]